MCEMMPGRGRPPAAQAGAAVELSEGDLKRGLMMSGERCRPIRTVLRIPACASFPPRVASTEYWIRFACQGHWLRSRPSEQRFFACIPIHKPYKTGDTWQIHP